MASSGPKVVDFGISHAVDGTALTQTGVIMGSPAWMSPEQAQGRTVAEAADVFSWGATVAFAATGRSPFGEGRPDAVIYRVVHEEPDIRGVEPRLLGMVRASLTKDPSGRPTADDLLVTLVKSAMGGQLPQGDSDAMTTVALDRTWRQPRSAPRLRITRKQVIWAIAACIVIAAFIAGAVYVQNGDRAKTGASHQESSGTHATKGSNSTTTTSTHAEASTTSPTSQSALVSATLPLVTCPTTYGFTQTSQPPPLPTSMVVNVPSKLASQLAVYADQGDGMKLVAPTGWSCLASYGADGGGGVDVYPSGEGDPNSSLSAGSSAEAVVGSQTSACLSCREGQACPLFAAAAADYQNDYQMGCPTSRPQNESVVPLSANVVSFMDPPGVAGTGRPSGGAYPANGVMTYLPRTNPNSDNGSYLETCTLPASEQSVCTVILDRYVDWYGSQ